MVNRPVRVLLVDDDEDDYVIARDLLAMVTNPKCVLEWRSTYDEGLAAILENRFDVYLLDYSLGAHDGIELVREAAQNNIAGPVLLLTAHDNSDLDVLAAAAGATDYLVKSHMTASLLGRAIRYALARHESNEALRRSAREKTVMLQEIHHRVKNNLQMISSLINFQMEHVKNPETLALLRVTQTRVHSIALVHEKLYESPLLATVDMGEYARALVTMLMQTHGEEVRAEVRAVDIVLPVDLGLPFGLILSELVTNALKHAFPAGAGQEPRSPVIVIDLRRDRSEFVFSVADNGVGLSQSLSAPDSKSLGLRLVGMFAEQLGGTVVFSRGEGTRCTVTFPVGDGSYPREGGSVMGASILVVEDEVIVAQDIQRTLIGLGYEVTAIVATGDGALRAAETCWPDLVLMDIRLKGPFDGIKTAVRLQEKRGVPIVFLTAHSDEATLARVKGTLPYGYILKPFTDRELRTSIEIALGRFNSESQVLAKAEELTNQNAVLSTRAAERKSSSDRLLAAARIDPLTEASNRLHLETELEGIADRVHRYGHRCCVAFCDIDTFKSYNDTFGHLAGDDAIRAVARAMKDQLRRSDGFFRYGGDEFLAFLAEQTLSSARECMERVSAAVVAIPTEANGGVLIRGVTISIGIAEFRGAPRPETSQSWLKRADAALYRAKSRGRNCVEIAT